MPSVPLFQGPVRVSAERGFEAPRTAAPGQPGGQQIERAGRALMRASLQVNQQQFLLKERQTVSAVKRGQALAGEHIANANRAYHNMEGKDATGDNRVAAWEMLENQVNGIRDKLEQGDQQDLYQRAMQQTMLVTRQSWDRHEDRQSRIEMIGAGQAVLGTKVDGARQAAVESVLNPRGTPGEGEEEQADAAAISLAGVKGEAMDLAAQQGMGPERTAELVQAATTEVHAGAVGDLVEMGRSSEAGDYLKGAADRGEVDPDSLLKLRRLVHGGSVKEEGADIAASILDDLRDLPAAQQRDEGLSVIRAAEQRGDFSLETRDAAAAELKAATGELKAREVEVRRATTQEYEQFMIDNPGRPLPATLQDRVEDQGLSAAKNQFDGSTGQYPTNQAFYREMFNPASPLFTLPLPEFLDVMGRELHSRYYKMATAAWNIANEAAKPIDYSFYTPAKKLENKMESLGIADDPEKAKLFREEAEGRIESEGIDPSNQPSEVDRIFGEMEQDTMRLSQTFWWDDEILVSQATQEQIDEQGYITVRGRDLFLGGIGIDETNAATLELERINAKRAGKNKRPLVMTKALLADLVDYEREQERASSREFFRKGASVDPSIRQGR